MSEAQTTIGSVVDTDPRDAEDLEACGHCLANIDRWLTDRGYAIIKVGSVPEWMEEVAERGRPDESGDWWYGDEEALLSDAFIDLHPLYAPRSSDGAPEEVQGE